MGLRIIVTVKQVPDTKNISNNAIKADGTVNRAVLPAIFNPEDLNALEEALKIKEKVGGSVVAITMGPPKAVEVLKQCLYRGADDAILVTDRQFAGADTLATSYALKCAVNKIGEFDLIFCGRQAIDGDTAQVGPQLAEKLGINQLTNVFAVEELDLENKKITVKRRLDDGYEVIRSRFPVLLTVNASANEPRPPSVKRMLGLKKITADNSNQTPFFSGANPDYHQIDSIHQWNVETIGADPTQCGLSGSPTKVKAVQNVVLKASEFQLVQNTPEGISGLIHTLMEDHII